MPDLVIAPVVPEILERFDNPTEEHLSLIKQVLESDWTLLDDFDGVYARFLELGIELGVDVEEG